MATNRYSLTDYILTLTIPDNQYIPESIRGQQFSIGGAGIEAGGVGSFLGEISLTRNKDAWETEGDYTGSWVHNKNNDKTGECKVQIRQVSDMVIRLAQICSIFESIQENVPGLKLQVTSAYVDNLSGTNIIATCNDCYIKKMADITFGDTAQLQDWTFTCGQIFYYE